MPHFDSIVTLGNVLTIGAFLTTALFAWRDLNWRVRNLETWRESNLHTTDEAVKNISLLREAIVGIQKLAEGQDRRLEMLEDRIDRRTH